MDTAVAAPPDEATFEQGKIAAILSYWFWPIAWFLKGQNPFAKYHVAQGFVYLIFAVLVWVALVLGMTVFGAVLGRLPVVGPFILYILLGVSLAVLVAFLYISIKGTLNVLARKQEPLPFLSKVPLLGTITAKIGNPA
jgi:hypothetical protein